MPDPFSNGTTLAQPRSQRAVAVDNFLRKSLRIGDPRDPAQVAAALLSRYPQEADRERREMAGLPYSTFRDASPEPVYSGVAAMAELAQANDDLYRDAQALTSSSQLKDVRVELSGWSRSIRRIADDGLAASRQALDAIQHDRALASRSLLGNYARLSRYVGALSDSCNPLFRRLGQSTDILAALILVGIGEGLAASGITRSTAIVRVAGTELLARRNAVVGALRSLTGSVDAVLGQEEWPRGLESFRRLTRRLDESGQSDLRALLEESALAQAMDELVDLCAGGNVNGLRELSTSAALLIHRFERLIQYGRSVSSTGYHPSRQGSPESPPLAAFTASLQLFVDAFTSAAGSRLLYIARPPILVYGLYGAAGADLGAKALIELTVARGNMLEMIDCYGNCGCDEGTVRCQVLLDFLLFLLDRAIDAYAVGDDPSAQGDPERRAAAFGLVMLNALMVHNLQGKAICNFDRELKSVIYETGRLLVKRFWQRKHEFKHRFPKQARGLMIREIQMLYQSELQVERLVRSLSPSCRVGGLFDLARDPDGEPESLIRVLLRSTLKRDLGADVDLPDPVVIPPTFETSAAGIAFDRPYRRDDD